MLPNDIENFGSILLTEVHNTNPYTSVNLLKATYTASIDFIFGKYIIINAKNQTIPENAITISNSLYDIDFFPNRMTCRTAQRAIEIIENHQLENYFKNFELPNSTKRFIRDSDLEFDNFNWENKKIANNNEQEQAIRNIVNQTAFPSPYVLFGPPGTGKTTTIIEAIVQIIKLKPNARILLTSNTNSNCDNLGIRLLEYVSCNKILRIYSSRYDEHSEKIPVALKQISNYRLETLCKCKSLFCKEKHPFDNPSYEEFYTARVVIATLCSSGRFVTGGIKSDHFDYIFIDEAATNAEPYTLIPISGLGSRFEQITANIVLCGDHKQLGPIIADHYNIILGFRTPMMKRLLMMKKYNCYTHEEVERNSIYVTKLLKNFRSNERILEFSNQNFYNGALQSVASKKIQNFAVGWSALNNPSLPILFHASLSPCYQVGTSLINDGEIALVNYYVQMLLSNGVNGKRVSQKDIGIISTYRAQRENMVLLFKSCYSDVEIGTIDSFQGCEKKIIILSTVRSNTKTFGFLRSSKRLNVALTRAQSLLIIIGNPITLKLNEIWKKFILHCEYYRTFVNHQLCVPAYINNTLFQDIKEPIRLHGR